MQDHRLQFLGGGLIFAFLAVVYVVSVSWNWSSIKQAINVIDAAADMLRQTKRLIVVNIYYFFLTISIQLLWCGSFLALLSMGEITANTKFIAQGKTITFTEEQQLVFWKYAIVLVFGIVWIQGFINR